MAIDLKKIKHKNLAHFRFKKLGADYLLTNEVGEYVFLRAVEFQNFIEGDLKENSEIYKELVKKSFIKNKLDLNKMYGQYAKKNFFLFSGPSLHIFVVTLRCSNKCLYCHASAQSMQQKNVDMSLETARKALDLVFQSPNEVLAIEFQGGEPLANWETVKFIIQEAKKRNKKAKKNLEFRLTSNFNLMTKEKAEFLIKNKVGLAVSLDGPEKLHNQNRPLVEGKTAGGNYANAVKWTKFFNKQKNKINGIVTVSRFSLDFHKERVDEYVKLKFKYIFLRPLNPFGFSKMAWKKIGYTAQEYLDFYKKSLDYLIELNLQGIDLRERTTLAFLEKILGEYDPNVAENRSPCGAGIGQLAYNYNGKVYTCDEGRMLSAMGDENFRLGNVDSKYREIIGSSVIKTTCLASCLNGNPGCNECAYLPYCGVCPIYNHTQQGNIFGQMPTNDRCKISKGILDYLFVKMRDKKAKVIFEKWLKM
jgi:uncharacterized protein